MDELIPIAVILQTYNGDKYIEDQINSILNQNNVSVHLFVRDDGSKDGTLRKLKEYKEKYTNFTLINEEGTENVGIRDGYMTILSQAVAHPAEFQFFAFADQDDYWLPEKLITAINRIKGSNNPEGAMYYSNKTLVDENLNNRRRESLIKPRGFSDFYFVSCAYGCTMVINRRMAERSIEFVSSSSHFHDDWVHRLAICLNADIVFDENSYILYRQHGDNACGTFATDDKTMLHLINRALHFLVAGDGQNRSSLAADILEHYSDRLDESTKAKLFAVATYKESLKNKLTLLKTADMSQRRKRNILIWKIKVLLSYF